jgi:hypothetical protein
MSDFVKARWVAVAGFTELSAGSSLIVSKVLPAGSYLVFAKAQVRAVEGTASAFVGTSCEIWDESSEVKLDEAESAGGLGEYTAGKFGGAWALPMQAAVSSGGKIELQVWCSTTANTSSAKIAAIETQLSALQTSSNS